MGAVSSASACGVCGAELVRQRAHHPLGHCGFRVLGFGLRVKKIGYQGSANVTLPVHYFEHSDDDTIINLRDYHSNYE